MNLLSATVTIPHFVCYITWFFIEEEEEFGPIYFENKAFAETYANAIWRMC